jgi:flagellar L-ring protein precursor FlgH
MNQRWPTVTVLVAAVAMASAARAQSSSLFLDGEERAAEKAAASQPARSGPLPANAGAATPADPDVNAPLNETSFMAVSPPRVRTFKMHDFVTIIVIESMRYRSDNQFQQDKRWDLEGKLSKWFRIHDDKLVEQPFKNGVPEVSLQTNDRRTGNGRQNRQDELTTRITAEVIDVKPNGQLVLQATKTVEYAEEVQVVTLIGRCRSDDVSAANSVLSTQLVDLEVRTKNTGQVNDASKRGWLQKIFDFARPF